MNRDLHRIFNISLKAATILKNSDSFKVTIGVLKNQTVIPLYLFFQIEYSEVEESFTDVELHDVNTEKTDNGITEDAITAKETESDVHKPENGQAAENSTPELKTKTSKRAALKQALRPCLRKENPLPENPTVCQKIKDMFLLPPHGIVGFILQITIVCLQIWGILAAITGSDALPGGNFFSLLVLFVLCVIGGRLISLVNLPPLLGKIFMKFAMKVATPFILVLCTYW